MPFETADRWTREERSPNCAVCGQRLGIASWVINYPHSAHEECVDWTKMPFPYPHRAGLIHRGLRRTNDRAIQRDLAALLRRIQVMKRRWPEGARETLAEWKEFTPRARELLRSVDEDLAAML